MNSSFLHNCCIQQGTVIWILLTQYGSIDWVVDAIVYYVQYVLVVQTVCSTFLQYFFGVIVRWSHYLYYRTVVKSFSLFAMLYQTMLPWKWINSVFLLYGIMSRVWTKQYFYENSLNVYNIGTIMCFCSALIRQHH